MGRNLMQNINNKLPAPLPSSEGHPDNVPASDGTGEIDHRRIPAAKPQRPQCANEACVWTEERHGKHTVTPQCPVNLWGAMVSFPSAEGGQHDRFISVRTGSMRTRASLHGGNWKEMGRNWQDGPYIPVSESDVWSIHQDVEAKAQDHAEKNARARLARTLAPLRAAIKQIDAEVSNG